MRTEFEKGSSWRKQRFVGIFEALKSNLRTFAALFNVSLVLLGVNRDANLIEISHWLMMMAVMMTAVMMMIHAQQLYSTASMVSW